MRTVEIKNIESNDVVWRGHFWNFDQAKLRAGLAPGQYAIQGTNSMASRPRISAKAWAKAETFTI